MKFIVRDTPRPVLRDGLLSNVAGLARLRRDHTWSTWLGQLLT